MQTVGTRIKKLRQEKGMTQEELGNLLGITKSAVQKIESGKTELTADRIRCLCRIFKIYPRFFVYDSEIEYIHDLFGEPNPFEVEHFMKYPKIPYVEHVISQDMLSIMRLVIALNHDGRKRLFEYAQVLSKVSDFKRDPDEVSNPISPMN